MSVVIAVGTLCGEIALSVYLNRWVNDRRFIIYSTAAAAVSKNTDHINCGT